MRNVYPNSQFTRKKRASIDYDLNKYPIRTSVKLFAEQNDTLNDNCTGSLVSRRHVLTAAHCVANINSNVLRYDSIYACPVYDNGNFSNAFPCSWVQEVYIFKNWSVLGEDFALLELKEPVGDLAGWISIGFNASDSMLAEGIYYKFTYPGTTMLPIDSTEYNGDTLYYNYGKADLFDTRFIGIHNTNGIPGESGSSLIKVENNIDYTSYGVLTFSVELKHSRFNNRTYYYLESVIHDDLLSGIGGESANTGFTVFPNPASDRLWIRNPGNVVILKVEINDILGKTVFSQNINAVSSNVNVTSVPEGVYVMCIKTSAGQVTRKIIIHRN